MTARDDRRAGVLTVLADREDTCAWQALVSEVGRIAGLRPSVLSLPDAGAGWAAAVMRVAAASPGPVLVLPRGGAPGTALAPGPAPLRRAVIASDGSSEVSGGARLCALHLLRSGVRTTVLVVLTGETAPPMWEGTGHHAEAWRGELGRRHGRPDRIDVMRGTPGPTVRARATGSDLVVLLWRREVAEGRAAVLREVLDGGVPAPTLLVPLAWVERAWSGDPALTGAG